MKYKDLNTQAQAIAREEVENSFAPWDIDPEPEEHGTISYDVNNGETLSITQNGHDRLAIVEYGSGLVRGISSGEMVMMMNLFNVMQENGFDESLGKCFDALEK